MLKHAFSLQYSEHHVASWSDIYQVSEFGYLCILTKLIIFICLKLAVFLCEMSNLQSKFSIVFYLLILLN